MCTHGRQRRQCTECVSIEEVFRSKRFCRLCTSKLLSARRVRSGMQFCAGCDDSVPERIETVVVKKLLEILKEYPPSAIDNVVLGKCATDSENKKHRPDLAWVLDDRIIIIEIDENGGHPNYEATCEMARMSRIVETLQIEHGFVPVIFLRFNPDEYDK
jgi:hypothetical protein